MRLGLEIIAVHVIKTVRRGRLGFVFEYKVAIVEFNSGFEWLQWHERTFSNNIVKFIQTMASHTKMKPRNLVG